MTNNDIFRRLRYIFDFGDDKMIELFAHTNVQVTRAEISDWLKKEEDAAFQILDDRGLSIFLNGLIIEKRGKKEDGTLPEPEELLSNNAILRKIKIALNYIDDDMLSALEMGGKKISKHELSAFFRNQNHKHYMHCNNQLLRNFLTGLQLKLRPNAPQED